jgi:hypothetical protein
MVDYEDQESPFQGVEPSKTAWVRLVIREASKRGYTIGDLAALLDEPEMTVEEAVERILFTREPKPN